jgi:hypothetical protein
VSASRQQKLTERKRRIATRLRARHWKEQAQPMFQARNVHYELADRDRGLGPGGIGALHLLARRVGLIERLDAELSLLKRHLPHHESDHVLNVAYNLLAGGTCLDDLELLRNDEVYLVRKGVVRQKGGQKGGRQKGGHVRKGVRLIYAAACTVAPTQAPSFNQAST